MSFEYIQFLMLLPIVVIGLVVFYIFSEMSRRNAINRWIAPHMRSVLLHNFSRVRRYIKWGLIVIAMGLILIGLARPQWGYEWQEHKAEGAEVLFIIDTSKSMLAEDIKPNRMERAKMVVLDFLNAVKASRVGIIAFAGEAFLQCPLTLDYDAFRLSLGEIETGIIYQGGTNIEAALRLAQATFKGPSDGRNIVLITDGENLGSDVFPLVKQLDKEGIPVYTIGDGLETGELIPIADRNGKRDYVRDESGKLVTSKLDGATLKSIAKESNGLYAPINNINDVNAIFQALNKNAEKFQATEVMRKIPMEQYHWFVMGALILLVFEFLMGLRKWQWKMRKNLLVGVLVVGFVFCNANYNLCASESMSDAGQESEEMLAGFLRRYENEPHNAKLLYNIGTMYWYLGHYDESERYLSEALKFADVELQQKIYYNLGDTRYRRGEMLVDIKPQETLKIWERGLNDYENAMELDPNDYAAKHNYDFLKKKIEELKQQLQDQQKNENKDQQQNKDQQDKKQPEDQKGQGQERQNSNGSQDQQNEQNSNNQNSSKNNSDGRGENQSESQSNSNDGNPQESQSNSDQKNNEGEQEDREPSESDGSDDGQKEESSGVGESPQGSGLNDEEEKGDSQGQGQDHPENEKAAGAGSSSGMEAIGDDERKEGGMSRGEAVRLLDSLKGEEKRLPFRYGKGSGKQENPEKKYKDW